MASHIDLHSSTNDGKTSGCSYQHASGDTLQRRDHLAVSDERVHTAAVVQVPELDGAIVGARGEHVFSLFVVAEAARSSCCTCCYLALMTSCCLYVVCLAWPWGWAACWARCAWSASADWSASSARRCSRRAPLAGCSARARGASPAGRSGPSEWPLRLAHVRLVHRIVATANVN